MILVFSATLVLAAALLAPRYLRDRVALPERWDTLLRARGPWVAAALSIAVVWFTWDALDPVPKVHDEVSYLLQADIFARFRWTAPSPPIPDFFEQPHVLVVPKVASKYPPGTALLYAVGALVGFHALVPLLLAGVTGFLLFKLVDRLTDPWTALLAWLVWLSAPIVLRFQPSYFSETVTTPLVLTSWWLLLDWRESHRRRTLVWMALALGWCAITRPLTALVFAVPIGVLVVRDTLRLRLWRDLGAAFAAGCLVLAVLPLWSWRTTGSLRESPVTLYRRDYMPFDKLGFTPDTTPPRRTVSPVLRSVYDYFLSARKEQTAARAPQIFADRALQVLIALFQEARLPLGALALLGLFAGGRAGAALRFGALSGGLLLMAHVSYPHWAPWTIYYVETAPTAAALAAVGAGLVARRIRSDPAATRLSLALATAAVAAFAVPIVFKWRLDHRTRSAFDRHFREQLKQLPQHSIVFVRYSPRVAQHIAVVVNYADLNAAPIWVVHDLGPRNGELRRLVPDRSSFDFEEDQLVSRNR